MYLLHRKAQSFRAWRDFNKTFCSISAYHKWMFKLQSSSIFNFDQAHQSWISGILGVKNIANSLESLIRHILGPAPTSTIFMKILVACHSKKRSLKGISSSSILQFYWYSTYLSTYTQRKYRLLIFRVSFLPTILQNNLNGNSTWK